MGRPAGRTRRDLLCRSGAAILAASAGGRVGSASAVTTTVAVGSRPAGGMNVIEFEQTLARMRAEYYRHPPVDVLRTGFRPVGGSLADFTTVHHRGRDHVFYIERRLQEGTPFFPGHEIYFGHASTADLLTWEVHEPVMLIRPGSWEEAHVWAPFILPHGRGYIMAYTGLNRHLSQNLGLASSEDLFDWRRWASNPISPLKDAAWAAWWENDIASCRDPHMLRHDGRIWMAFTANTREGASCIALASTEDFTQWKDHGPILLGPSSGYEPVLWGGHPQGSLESCNLSFRAGRWFLLLNATIRGRGGGCWILESDRMDSFHLDAARSFWPDGACVEIVRDRGSRSLLAGLRDGRLRFGEVDWSAVHPVGRTLTGREELDAWRSA